MIQLLITKPMFGATVSAGSVLLTWIGILTPILGFVGVIIGIVAGIYSGIHQRNLVLQDNKTKEPKPVQGPPPQAPG